MWRSKLLFFICILLLMSFSLSGKSPVRLKDIAIIDGLRENQLMGFGLVTGLQGKGDSRSFKMTKKMLQNLAANHGYNISIDDINSKNIAAVLVIAQVGPFAREGDQIDTIISSIGDAKSLEGGILLQTSLKAADNNVYAVAQGRLIVGTKDQNTQTSASIPDGAILEKNVISDFIIDNKIRVVLKYPDFVTSNQINEAILSINPNLKITSIDPGMIEIELAEEELNNPVAFIAQLELLSITPDYISTIVVDKKSGTIVMGEDIIIQECSISTPFAQIKVGNLRNKKTNMKIQGQSVGDLVNILNEAGLKTNEIISLIESIHKIGAINAKLILL